MITITIDAPTTTNFIKTTDEEVDNVLNALDELYSHRAIYIKGYDTGKFELMYWDVEH